MSSDPGPRAGTTAATEGLFLSVSVELRGRALRQATAQAVVQWRLIGKVADHLWFIPGIAYLAGFFRRSLVLFEPKLGAPLVALHSLAPHRC